MINLDQLLATPGSLTNFRTYEEVLRSARDRLADPARWTQGCYARASNSFVVRPKDARACQWCMLGAIACESNHYGIIPPPIITFLEEMLPHVFGESRFDSLGAMNDYVSHDVMLGFMDSALSQFPQRS